MLSGERWLIGTHREDIDIQMYFPHKSKNFHDLWLCFRMIAHLYIHFHSIIQHIFGKEEYWKFFHATSALETLLKNSLRTSLGYFCILLNEWTCYEFIDFRRRYIFIFSVQRTSLCHGIETLYRWIYFLSIFDERALIYILTTPSSDML